MLKRLIVVLSMVLLGASPLYAAGVALLTGPLEPSQTLATLNSLIVTMNGNYAPAGSGTLNSAIAVTNVTTPVNLLGITPGATGSVLQLTVGGPSVDANVGLSLFGNGTGATLLGGSTTTLAGLQVAQPASRVNGLLVTPGATGTLVQLTSATAGADANAGMFIAGSGTGAVGIGGTTATLAGLQVAQPASRVNGIVVTPGATTVVPQIAVANSGADANIGVALLGNGTGNVLLGGATTTNAAVQVAHGTTNVNAIVLTGTNTGTAPGITIGGASADANRDLNVAANGTGIVTLGGARATCSGTTTATCTGQRFTASVTGLTTAAGGVSATAMTVTNTNVVAATSLVVCNVNGYSGTGQPIATNVTPGTGTVSFQVTNIASSGSLNATVPVACVVL